MNNFNLAFEEFMAWHIDTGTFYISGRDIIAMIIGFLFCLILWALFDGKEIHGTIHRNENKDIPGDRHGSIQKDDKGSRI